MRIRIFFRVLACLLLCGWQETNAATVPGIDFRENKGQWAPEILFRAELNSGYLFITRKGLSYVFYQHDSFKHQPVIPDDQLLNRARNQPSEPGIHDDNMAKVHAYSLDFQDISDRLIIEPGREKPSYSNFFTGNDPSKWVSHVASYGEITFKGLYPGIDFRLYSKDGFLKYDIIADPGADISRFNYRYSGIDSIKKAFNSLYIFTSLGQMIENSPFAYQISGNDTVTIPCRYHVTDGGVRFSMPEGYDHKKRLVIDPVLVFSTYSGSTMDNWGNTATFDKYGNVYSGGTVRSFYGGSLPVTKGAFQTTFGGVWDVAILKFDSTGSRLLYATYLGGSDTETPLSLIVNHNNELVILGITGSNDFPVLASSYSGLFSGGDTVTNALGLYNSGRFFGVDYLHGSDFFIAKLSEDGTMLTGSTYLGGSRKEGINNAPGLPLSRNYGDEFRGEVNVDINDNVYIISNTSSPDFPIVNGYQSTYGGGAQDAVIAKLSPDLSSLIWSTFLGGDDQDAGYGIRIVDDRYVVVAGGTESYNFPVTSGAYQRDFGGDADGFVARISDDGSSLLSGTYVGTNSYDQVYFTDIDAGKNIYVYGQTSGRFPVSDSVYVNRNSGQFIEKFNPDLTQSLFSTVIGSGRGAPDISPTAFLVNECGNIFLSGWGGRINHYAEKYIGGYTTQLPVTDNAFQRSTDGSDFYLMVLEKNARSLLYATFLGAATTQEGEHVDGGTSRFDKRGIVYHAICACRDNSQFPTTPGVWSSVNQSPGGCNNGVFKFDLASLKAAFTTNTPRFDSPGITKGCYPFDVVFMNRSVGGKLFLWDFGDNSGPRVQNDSVYHEYKTAGTYHVSLYAYDENTCQKVDYATGRINVYEPHFSVPPDTTICQGDQVKLNAGGAVSYEWSPGYGLNDPAVSGPIASPDSTVSYQLKMIDANTCVKTDTVEVNVVPSVRIDFKPRIRFDCKESSYIELKNFTENADRYLWDLGDGRSSEEKDLVYHYSDTGSYAITLHAWGGNVCADSASVGVHINRIFVPNVITPNNDKHNDFFRIHTDIAVKLKILNRWGEPVFESDSYQNNWNATGLPSGVYYYEMNLDPETTCNGWIQVLK